MYICLCHGVTDSEVRQAVSDGASNADDIARALGAGTGCGGCFEYTQRYVEQLLKDQGFAASATDLSYAAA